MIQLYHQPFDSLLGTTFTSTNFTWKYNWWIYPPGSFTPALSGDGKVTWISDAQGRKIGTMTAEKPGIQWLAPNPDLKGVTFWSDPVSEAEPFTQVMGRLVSEPDILFVADNLPSSADGVPIGFGRDVPVSVTTNAVASLPGVGATNEVGPGTFDVPAVGSATAGGMLGGAVNAKFAFAFNKIGGHLEDFEVIWSGETSVVGHQDTVPVLWGHIKGPGPNDIETFPKSSTQDRIWNSVMPDTAPPSISLVSDSAGAQPIEANTLTRTEEVLTIIGGEMASVTAIEIMTGDLVMQTLMPVDKYIVSNSRIDIPAGIISDAAEGSARQVRVWNSVGVSEKSTQSFTIETGRPVITGTSSDNFVFDRAQILTVNGYGFKSRTVGETKVDRIRVDDINGAAVEDSGTKGGGASDGLPYTLTNIQVLSDTQIVLPINAMSVTSDGSNRLLRVARKAPINGSAANVDAVLSPATNSIFTAVTTKPSVSSLSQLTQTTTWESMATTGMYKRDRTLEINGTALNTATTIEVTQEDGTSFANPVFIQLPNAAVAVEDNGSRIQVSADAIPWADADNNSSAKRAFKIYNAVGNTDLIASQTFVVNKQPVVDGIGGFAVAGHFNRDKTLGDDFSIFGSGFMAVKNIIITDDNDTTQSRISITLPTPGITVTDTSIAIDTQTFQIGSGADTMLDSGASASAQRIIKLVSARDDAISSVAQRFKVGAPPTLATLTGLTAGNYTRDAMTLGVTGTGFGHTALLEIVDTNGNPEPDESEGCGCSAQGQSSTGFLWGLGLWGLLLRRRR